jgi:hypothetical protein
MAARGRQSQTTPPRLRINDSRQQGVKHVYDQAAQATAVPQECD